MNQITNLSEALQQHIDDFTEANPVGSVFFSDGSYKILSIILEANALVTAYELHDAVQQISLGQHLTARVFDYQYAIAQFEKGNLYFLMHCRIENLVFQRQHEGSYLDHRADLLTALNASGITFNNELRRISKISDEAFAWLEQDNFVQAALAVHLYLLELYRTAARFLTGKASPTESLYAQQDQLRPSNAEIASLFDEQDVAEKELLLSIEETYNSGFGNASLSVSQTGVAALISKARIVRKKAERIFAEVAEDCRSSLPEAASANDAENVFASLQIPAAAIQPDSLKAIVAEIVPLANPELIYLQHSSSGDAAYNVLIVLVDEDREEPGPTSWHLDAIAAGHKKIRYRLYTRKYAEEQLATGNLFFINGLLFGNIVYADSEASPVPLSAYDIEGLLLKARQVFKDKMAQVKGFREGAAFYASNANYNQAAFALRQALETLYKFAEYIILGQEHKVSRLHEHQMNLRNFSQAMAQLFTITGVDERGLMRLLDDVYKKPHDGSVTVSEAAIEIIQTKATRLEQEVATVFEKLFRYCESRHRRPTGRESHVAEPIAAVGETVFEGLHPGINQVADLIKGYLKTDSIHCFGQRHKSLNAKSAISAGSTQVNNQVHFDLLVISSDTRPNVIADLSELIRVKTGFVNTVTLLVHKPNHVLYAIDKFRHFFYQILNHGELIYHNPATTLITLPECPPRDVKAAKAYWRRRDTIAEMFLESTSNDNSDEGQGEMAMMHIIAEHVCLGLIEVFLGYRPRHFALGYLFDLCGHFSTLPSEIFPRETETDKKLFKMLSLGLSNLRRNEFKEYTYTNTEVIHDRCHEFHRQATLLIENELDRLADEQKTTI